VCTVRKSVDAMDGSVVEELASIPTGKTYAIVSRMRKVISTPAGHESRSYVGQANLQDRRSSLVKLEGHTFGEVAAGVTPPLSKTED
jgi:hypothetical protein